MMGGFAGFMGGGVGTALIRIGADYTGLRSQARQAMAGLKQEMQAGARNLTGVQAGQGPMKGLNRELDTALKKTQMLQKAMKAVFLGVGMVGISGIGAAINAAVAFESAFAGVEKTVDATTEELAGLREEFLQMAKEMPIAATELARIGEAAGALGVAVPDIKEFTEVVATIGATTNVSTDEAATALGQLSNVLNLTSDDYKRFASTLVDLGNKGASTEKQILEITRRFGSSAKLFGLKASDTLAIGSSAANLGMQPELASSALSRLTMRLNEITGSQGAIEEASKKAGIAMNDFVAISLKGGDAAQKLGEQSGYSAKELKAIATSAESLDVLQQAMGVTAKEFERIKRTDPARIFEEMFKGMGEMDAQGRQQFIKRLLGPAASAGGGVGMQQLMLGLADSIDRNLTPSLNTGTRAWKANTAATDEAEKRYKSTASQFVQMKGLINDVLIRVGTGFLPTVNAVLGAIAETLPKVIDAIGKIYSSTLEGPFTALIQSGGRLLEVLTKILFDWGPGGEGESVGGAFQMLADVLAIVAKQLTVVLDVLTAITDNPVMDALGKMVILLGAAALAIKGMSALRGMLAGAGGGMLRALSGGRLGGAVGLTAEQKAATTQMTAAEMQLEAARLQMRGGAAGAAGGLATAVRPGGAGLMPYSGAYSNQWRSTSTAALSTAGAGMFTKMQADLRKGVLTGIAKAKSIGTSMAGGASQLLGAAGKVFWGAMVADLVGNLASPMIADMFRKNPDSRRLAAEFDKGIIPGIMGWVETQKGGMGGTDTFLGRPSSYKIGQYDVPLERLKAIYANEPQKPEGMSDTDFAALQSKHKVTQREVGTLMDAVEGAETELQALQALADLGKYIAANPIPKQIQLNVDLWDAALDAAGGLVSSIGGLFGGGSGKPDIGNLGITAREMTELEQSGAAIAESAQRAFRDGIIKQAKEQGFEMPGFQLGQLNRQQVTGVMGLLDNPMPEGAEWLRDWSMKRIAGLDTKKLLPEEGSFTETSGLQQLVKDVAGLGEWARVQRDEFGPYFDKAQEWLGLFGKEIEKNDSGSNADRADIIAKVMGIDRAKLNPKNQKQIDRWWTEVTDRAAYASEIVGLDQRGVIADKAREGLVNALRSGASISQREWDAIMHPLYDGMGNRADDVGSRVGDAIRVAFATKAKNIDYAAFADEFNKEHKGDKGFIKLPVPKEGTKPDPKVVAAYRQHLVDTFNAATKDLTGPGGETMHVKDYGDWKDAMLGSLVDDFDRADDQKAHDNIQKTLQGLFPGEFETWDKVVAAMMPKEGSSVAAWADRFAGMVTETSTPAADLGKVAGSAFDSAKNSAVTPFVVPPGNGMASYNNGLRDGYSYARGYNYAAANGISTNPGNPGNRSGHESPAPGVNSSGSPDDRDRGTAGFMGSMGSGIRSLMSGATPQVPSFAMASAGTPQSVSNQSSMAMDRSQTINVQRMEVFGPEDETSILRTLSFMAPGE